MVYTEEGGLRNPDKLTYIRPTAKPSAVNTVVPENVIDGFTVGTLADEIGIEHKDNHDGSDPFNTADFENEIRAMDE